MVTLKGSSGSMLGVLDVRIPTSDGVSFCIVYITLVHCLISVKWHIYSSYTMHSRHSS